MFCTVLNFLGRRIQIVMVFTIFVGFWLYHVSHMPFLKRSLNNLESLATFSSIIVLFFGLAIVSKAETKAEADLSDSTYVLSDSEYKILISIYLAALFIFFSFWLVQFVKDCQKFLILKEYRVLYLYKCCKKTNKKSRHFKEKFRSKIFV